MTEGRPDPGLSSNGAYDGIIFDFDGTLVDSMPMHYEAYRRAFADAGLRLDQRVFYAHSGGPALESIPLFLGDRPCSWTAQRLHARKQEHLAAALQEGPPRPLAFSALLPLLHGRLRLGLASSGSRPGIMMVLDQLGWAGFFDTIVTGGDTLRGKPAPDPYLLAAQQLGCRPSRCMAVEDSDVGVASARAAGLKVIDVRDAVAARVAPKPE